MNPFIIITVWLATSLFSYQVGHVTANQRTGEVLISNNMTQEGMLDLINRERRDKGLPVLVENKLLVESATKKACHIRDNNYWSHNSPDGITPWYFFKEAGYHYSIAGENLIKGFDRDEDAMKALMASPKHRDNILGKAYKDIGIGRCGNITVQHFGVRL